MKLCLLGFFLAACLAAQAPKSAGVPRPQGAPGAASPRYQWRGNVAGVLSQPPANATVGDIERFEQYLISAVPYCTGLDPNDYEANRELARRMAAYLATVNTLAHDPQTRAAAVRASRAVAAFPCAFPTGQMPSQAAPAAPPPPGEPPFAQRAPELENVPAADKQTASELRSRYETDAAKAASAWRNAETMRASLAARGMSLNAQTAASVGRFQLFFERAAAALREHKWDEALSSLQGVEAETQKVVKAVGN